MTRFQNPIAAVMLAGLVAGASSFHPASADEMYELGEYLSGECRACHLSGDNAQAIPPINGWTVDSFVMVMEAYKDGSRDNAAMQRVARSLGEEEIRALAIFYEKQN